MIRQFKEVRFFRAEALNVGKVPWMQLDFFVTFCVKTKSESIFIGQ
jgi:hypothetical protein